MVLDIPMYIFEDRKVVDIIINVNPYISTNFNKHYNSYEVELLVDEKVICQHEDLADYHLLSLSKSLNFVCLKYHAFE